MGIGEIAGLSSAAIWATSSMLYSFARMTAWELNVWKNLFAGVIFLIHLWLARSLIESVAMFEAPLEAWCWLGGSSIVGIVIGDPLYLRSLQILGPRRALMVATASPIFGVIIGFFFMEDIVNLLLLLGVGLTVAGVGSVVTDKRAEVENPNIYPGRFAIGILMGVGAAFCQASGVALAKVGMAHGCEALEASFIRIFTASLTMIGLVIVNPQRYGYSRKLPAPTVQSTVAADIEREKNQGSALPFEMKSIVEPLWEWSCMRYFIPGMLMGTWIGIWLFQIAQQYSTTAVVTTLAATCPIFAIPLVWLIQGHRVSLQGILGTGIAVAGIYLVVANSG